MSNVKFIGQHRVREGADMALLPEPSDSGLWQAWEMPSGAVMLQALSNENKPVGPLLSFEKEQFVALFMSTSVTATRQLRRASSPDLLFQWYEQMLQLNMAESDSALAPAVLPVGIPGRQGIQGVPAGMHAPAPPEAMLPEYTGTETMGIPSPPPASFVPSVQEPAMRAATPLYVPPSSSVQMPVSPPPLHAASPPVAPLAQPMSGSPMAMVPMQQAPEAPIPAMSVAYTVSNAAAPPSAATPALSAQQPGSPLQRTPAQHELFTQTSTTGAEEEETLREQFHAIILQVREGQKSEALMALLMLMHKPAFMKNPALHRLFTEFGLALRREKHYEMALHCHLRALEVAPDDERVLFNIARTQFELGQSGMAREYLLRALEAEPEFALAKNFLYFLDGGQP